MPGISRPVSPVPSEREKVGPPLDSITSSQYTPTVYPGGGSGGGSGSGSTTMNYAPTQKAEGRFDQAWDAWSKKMAQPGLSPEERLAMKNSAQAVSQGQMQTQQQQLGNQLQNQGLTGSGFADAQLAGLRGSQAGQLQNTLSQMDTQNALAADKNMMELIGMGGGMAKDYGQLGLNYAQVNQDAEDQKLDWQKYFHQQYQDELARRYMEKDRKREDDMIAPPKKPKSPYDGLFG